MCTRKLSGMVQNMLAIYLFLFAITLFSVSLFIFTLTLKGNEAKSTKMQQSVG